MSEASSAGSKRKVVKFPGQHAAYNLGTFYACGLTSDVAKDDRFYAVIIHKNGRTVTLHGDFHCYKTSRDAENGQEYGSVIIKEIEMVQVSSWFTDTVDKIKRIFKRRDACASD